MAAQETNEGMKEKKNREETSPDRCVDLLLYLQNPFVNMAQRWRKIFTSDCASQRHE